MKNQYKTETEYGNLLQRPEWLGKREVILLRDHHRCLNCGSSHNLQVHHRQYHRNVKTGIFRNPWDYIDKYLITLCFNCHQAGHKFYKVPVFNV